MLTIMNLYTLTVQFSHGLREDYTLRAAKHEVRHHLVATLGVSEAQCDELFRHGLLLPHPGTQHLSLAVRRT